MTSGLITAVYAINIYIPMAMFVIMLLFIARYDLEDHYDELVAENDRILAGQ